MPSIPSEQIKSVLQVIYNEINETLALGDESKVHYTFSHEIAETTFSETHYH